MPTQTNGSPGARSVAVEELSGLALQERALTQLLSRHLGEASGPNRERLQAHVADSRRHRLTFSALSNRFSADAGAGEALAAVVRSGLAAAGTIGATAGQVLTLPLAVLRPTGEHERQLENAGVEGAGVANKLVILTALQRALEESGDEEALARLTEVRDDTVSAWDRLLDQTAELMGGLVRAKGA